MSALFRVVESGSTGKIAIATTRLLAGTELIREKPIFFLSDAVKNSSKNVQLEQTLQINRRWWGIHEVYKSLSPELKEKYNSLFGSVQGERSKLLRAALASIPPQEINLDIDEMVRIAAICDTNACAVDGGVGVFHQASRLGHSCLPNCVWLSPQPNSPEKVIRTIRPVEKDEELTISYNASFSLNPTHERRAKYVKSKDFRCECDKCSARADITRRFACVNQKCAGHHCACQSHSDKAPYLLPCTVCGVSPSKEAQAALFKTEAEVLSQIPIKPGQGFMDLLTNPQSLVKADQLDSTSMTPLALPLHYTSTYLLPQKFVAAMYHEKNTDAVAFAKQYIDNYSALVGFPQEQHYSALAFVAGILREVGSPEALKLAAHCYRLVIQQLRIIYGVVPDSMNDSLAQVLGKLREMKALAVVTSTAGIRSCAFCDSSSDVMNISLTECTQCRGVHYCSKECQRAHWKAVHSHECGR